MGNKIAFISGGTGGLGIVFASHFADRGYDLILTEHPDDKSSPVIEELKKIVNVEIITADFAREDDIIKSEEIIKRNSEIEVLVNNAGFFFGKPFWQKDIQDLEAMIKVHICVPVRFILAALPNMMAKNNGVIINISSLVSFIPVPQDSMYSATKSFSNSFIESLHVSVRDKGIKVQVLCPGFIRNTRFHERAGFKLSEHKEWNLLPWMEPEEVVKISARNLRKKNKVVVVPGWRNRAIRFLMMNMPRTLY